jgi:DNA-binding MurR/RpiR family transcriptional regulator
MNGFQFVRERSSSLITLKSALQTLTETERRLAEYILRAPEEILFATTAQISENCDVSPATVTRLCVKLGYGGFPDFKAALAFELVTPVQDNLEPVHRDDDSVAVIQKIARLETQIIQETATLIDPVALERASAALISARRVELYTYSAISYAVGTLASSHLTIIGIPAVVRWRSDIDTLCAGLLGHGDVAIGITQDGNRPSIVEAVEIAKQRGAMTMGITNRTGSPITQTAHISLITSATYVSPIGMFGLIDMLYTYTLLLKQRSSST